MIHHGDCRAIMAKMREATFDACITDPPYGDTSLQWDKVVPDWMREVARVLKPAASIWIFGSMRTMPHTFRALEEEGFKFSQDIVWRKQNGTGFHVDRFRRVHEHAVMFYRGAWADVYHDPQVTLDATARQVRRKTRPPHTGDIGTGHYTSDDGGPRLMQSVIDVRNEHGRAIHETQKPLGILTPLIRYSVPSNGRVLDPFAGSGSTCIAAKIEGRHAIGIEIDACYASAARDRLANDSPLFAEVA